MNMFGKAKMVLAAAAVAAVAVVASAGAASAAWRATYDFGDSDFGISTTLTLQDDASGRWFEFAGTQAACGVTGDSYSVLRNILAYGGNRVRFSVDLSCGEFKRICIANSAGVTCSTWQLRDRGYGD